MAILVFGLFVALLPMMLFGEGDWELPPIDRQVIVDSDEGLSAALEAVEAGDWIILEDGAYSGISLNEVSGTEDLPIVLMAKNSRGALIEGSRMGRNVKLSDCEYIEFYGMRFTGGEVWGVTLGPAFEGDSNSLGSRNVRFIDCEFDNAAQSLLTISGGSHDIEVIDCDFHDSGNNPGAKKPYAEGIYVGQGASLTDRSHDILIEGNRFYRIGNEDNWGEAIDVKCQVYRVQIIDNTIWDVIVDSGGAISVLADPTDYPFGLTDPDIVISGNNIRGVRKRPGGWNGAGICVGANGVRVKGNQVSETEGPSFLALTNAGNTSGNVKIYENVFNGEVVINYYGHGDSEQFVDVIFYNNGNDTVRALDDLD